MRRTIGTVAVSLLGLMMLTLMPTAAQQPDINALRSTRFHRMGNRAIPNHYIVVLDRDATGRAGDVAANAAQIAALVPEWNGTVTRQFHHALNGFTAFLSE